MVAGILPTLLSTALPVSGIACGTWLVLSECWLNKRAETRTAKTTVGTDDKYVNASGGDRRGVFPAHSDNTLLPIICSVLTHSNESLLILSLSPHTHCLSC